MPRPFSWWREQWRNSAGTTHPKRRCPSKRAWPRPLRRKPARAHPFGRGTGLAVRLTAHWRQAIPQVYERLKRNKALPDIGGPGWPSSTAISSRQLPPLLPRMFEANRPAPRRQAGTARPPPSDAAVTGRGTTGRRTTAGVVSPLFSPRGETKCVRGPSVQGARRSASGGVLEQYVEHGEQAQRSNRGPIACFDRQVVRNAG